MNTQAKKQTGLKAHQRPDGRATRQVYLNDHDFNELKKQAIDAGFGNFAAYASYILSDLANRKERI